MTLHGQQVDDAAKVLFRADRQAQRDGTGAEALADLADNAAEVSAGAVHLVDEGDARHLVAIGLTPHGLGLGLHAADRTEHRDRAIEDAQRALHFDGEVDVAGRVDDVDGPTLPLALGRRRRDRDAALLLLLHEVHGGSAVVNLADLVEAACEKQDALRRRGLTRINVSHDADIAEFF